MEGRFRKESLGRVGMGSSILELEFLQKYLLEDLIASLFKPLVASFSENMFSSFPGKPRCIFAIGRTLSKTQNNKNHKKKHFNTTRFQFFYRRWKDLKSLTVDRMAQDGRTCCSPCTTAADVASQLLKTQTKISI